MVDPTFLSSNLTDADSSRVAQLERKVDILVHAIVPSPESGVNAEFPFPKHPPTTHNTSRDLVSGPEESSPQSGRAASLPTSVSPGSSTFGPSVHTQVLRRSLRGEYTSAPFEEDRTDQILNIYRNELVQYFPFVIVPQISASEFRKERPFLFKSIAVAAAYRYGPCPKSLSKDIFKELSERVLIEGEKSLDLLQGLLALIAW